MTFNQIKEAIKPLLKQYCGVSDREAEEMIIDDDDTFDGRFLNEISEQMTGANIEGLAIGDKDFDINISQIDDNEYLTLISFGGCTDVTAANMAMFDYSQSDWDGMISIEYEVEEEGDPLIMSCSFIANNAEELHNNLAAIFKVFQNNEFKELLMNMLESFN